LHLPADKISDHKKRTQMPNQEGKTSAIMHD
jgi:hypothetical protein